MCGVAARRCNSCLSYIYIYVHCVHVRSGQQKGRVAAALESRARAATTTKRVLFNLVASRRDHAERCDYATHKSRVSLQTSLMTRQTTAAAAREAREARPWLSRLSWLDNPRFIWLLAFRILNAALVRK